MPKPFGSNQKSCPDEEFIRLYKSIGPIATSRHLGCTERAVHQRRANLSRFIDIKAPGKPGMEYPQRTSLDIKNGCVIIGSDFHLWPGDESVSLRAFKKFCKDEKPAAVILNGDILDFPQISRHPPIGWQSTPTVLDEIEAAQDHLNDIVKAAPRGCHKIWNIGNHDCRFETRMATVASEFKGLKGTTLEDHFPIWKRGWSAWINNEVVTKHRFRGGIHAVYANTLNAGKTMVTGHLHSQKVTPFTDYNGTRYGVDVGCIAATDHQAFTDYTEDNPKNWISGFVVLTFKDGRLMYPELVSPWDENSIQFRGQVIKV